MSQKLIIRLATFRQTKLRLKSLSRRWIENSTVYSKLVLFLGCATVHSDVQQFTA